MKTIAAILATLLLPLALLTAAGVQAASKENSGFKGWDRVGPNKPYTYSVVKSGDVAAIAGKELERFEIRAGDCGKTGNYNDCQHDREHVAWNETGSTKLHKEVWYSFSFYFPKDTPITIPDANIILAEFRPVTGGQINLSVEAQPDGLVAVVGSVTVQQKNDMKPPPIALWKLIDGAPKTDHWYDFELHAIWSHDKDGVIELYLDKTVVATLSGPNTAFEQAVHMQYGLYRPFVSKAPGPLPTQVIYFDRISKADTQAGLSPLNAAAAQ